MPDVFASIKSRSATARSVLPSSRQECCVARSQRPATSFFSTISSSSVSGIFSSGDTAPCYDCACRGMAIGSGVESDSLSAYCGLHSDSEWGLTCGDVTSIGKLNWVDKKQAKSEFSTVHVSLCSEQNSDCGLCQGGIHPSFRVRECLEANIWSCDIVFANAFILRLVFNGYQICKNNVLTILFTYHVRMG